MPATRIRRTINGHRPWPGGRGRSSSSGWNGVPVPGLEIVQTRREGDAGLVPRGAIASHGPPAMPNALISLDPPHREAMAVRVR